MSSSLAGIPPLPGLRGGASGRGLGSLAPLGGGARSSNNASGAGKLDSLDALSLGTPNFLKPKLGSTTGGGTSPRNNSSSSNLGSAFGSSTRGLYGSSSGSSSTHSPSSPSSSSSAAPIRPVRLAVRFSPPTLALEYSDNLRHPTRRRNRVRTFAIETNSSASSSSQVIARQLAHQHPEYLAESLVSQAQLVRLVRKALSRGDNHDSDDEATVAAPSSTSAGRSAVPVSSTGKRLHTLPSHNSAAGSGADDSYADSMLDGSLEQSHASASASAADLSAAQEQHGHGRQPEHEAEEVEEEEEAEEVDVDPDDLDGLYHPAPPNPHTDDLNRVSDSELAAKKAEMDKLFRANTLKPGDQGYVYDKQIEFQPTEDSEWD